MAFIMPILRVGKLKLEAKELVRDRTARKSSWAQTRPVLRITAPRTASGCDEAPDPGRPRRGSLGHCTVSVPWHRPASALRACDPPVSRWPAPSGRSAKADGTKEVSPERSGGSAACSSPFGRDQGNSKMPTDIHLTFPASLLGCE